MASDTLSVALWRRGALLLITAVTGARAEVPLTAPGPHGHLGGMFLPAATSQAPVALIIPGSGPTDHDGNNPRGLQANTYQLLAQGLAQAGIASLRIDKRGLYMSAAAVRDPNAVTLPDYVADVRTWLQVLRTRTRRPCIWLVGHSEGGLVALIAAQGRSDVCGLVLLGAAGRPLGEVLREQLARASPSGVLSHPVAATLDALEAGRHVDAASLPRPVATLLRPQVQGFLISAFSYDPAQVLKGYARPVLIVQGGRDLEIGEADARRLAAAVPQGQLLWLPDMNHVLKQVAAAGRAANLATYAAAALPLAPQLVSAIATFIEAPAAPKRR
jgi:uncharacterized protein